MPTYEILDSKFMARRTRLRTWSELRYVGNAVWSMEEEERLILDCRDITDDWSFMDIPPTESNSTLWAAAFERYSQPLSDLFTYGLKPHPKATRGARAKLLAPAFCQLLTEVLIHPVFQAKIELVRYVLQRVVCLRVGTHEPPVGPVPEMDDNMCDSVAATGRTLPRDSDSQEVKTQANHDALWLYIQDHGAHKDPDIAALEDALKVAVAMGNGPKDMPRDNMPNCGRLFFLQLWDLQLLVQVMNGMAGAQGYLVTGEYYRQWLGLTRRVRIYVTHKIDELVEAWFLRDERNYRVRRKLKQMGSDHSVYDIAEEEFRPLYIKSRFITDGMRAILCGDYLTAICPPGQEDTDDTESQSTIEDMDMVAGVEYQSSSDEGELPINEESGAGDDVGDDTEGHTKDDLVSSGERQRQTRSTSIASFFSISSSTRDDWEHNEEDNNSHPTQDAPFAQRSLLNCDPRKPVFRRRQDRGQDEYSDDTE